MEKFCRVCASECTALHVRPTLPAPEASFYARMFTAFGYPLKGDGIALLLSATSTDMPSN